MRPLFAIAPLALAFTLLGPSSQASPSADRSWLQALSSWVSGYTDRRQDRSSPQGLAGEGSFRSGLGLR